MGISPSSTASHRKAGRTAAPGEMPDSNVQNSRWSGIDFVSISQGLIVADCLSFRRADRTRRLTVDWQTPRTLALEDRLGVSLFERFSGGVRLTGAGNRFLDRARFALAQLEYAIDAAGAAGRGENGTLRIGVFSSIATGFLRELMHSYIERYPAVGLQVSEDGLREHIALIAKGRVVPAWCSHAIENIDGIEPLILLRLQNLPQTASLGALSRDEGGSLQHLYDEVASSKLQNPKRRRRRKCLAPKTQSADGPRISKH